jgi:hypothetical protein
MKIFLGKKSRHVRVLDGRNSIVDLVDFGRIKVDGDDLVALREQNREREPHVSDSGYDNAL